MRVRRGESGLEGIGECALSGIASVSWNVFGIRVSCPLCPSPMQTRQAEKMVGLGLYPSCVAVVEAF